MNYFELFEIPVQLKVDKATLPHKYFELSRKYHPDFFTNANNADKAEALEKSALLNQAFRTFQSQDETIKYVLKLKGLLEEDEKYDLPPAFLMEVLEINEAMMDIGEEPEKEKMKTTIDNLQNEIYATVCKIIENYKDEITTREELLQVKEYYYKKKYIDRIWQQLQD